jgi:hypothetical protein
MACDCFGSIASTRGLKRRGATTRSKDVVSSSRLNYAGRACRPNTRPASVGGIAGALPPVHPFRHFYPLLQQAALDHAGKAVQQVRKSGSVSCDRVWVIRQVSVPGAEPEPRPTCNASN